MGYKGWIHKRKIFFFLPLEGENSLKTFKCVFTHKRIGIPHTMTIYKSQLSNFLLFVFPENNK